MILELCFIRECPMCKRQLTIDNDDLTQCPTCRQYVKPILVNASASGIPESSTDNPATGRKERA